MREMVSESQPLIELQGVSKRFYKPLDLAGRVVKWLGVNARDEVVHAVHDVSIAVSAGDVIGLVGESGCGKSTLGRIVAGIYSPTDGRVLFHGTDVTKLTEQAAKEFILTIQMIFQDPFASLNPRLKIAEIIGEAPVAHGLISRSERDDYVDTLMERVGLDPSYKSRFPHQFSGGQSQRIGIARALAVRPQMIVCDEAVAALDVSIQAQILNLFMDLRNDLNLTYLFISHDLSVVEHLSDHVAIMYLGRIVERAPAAEIFYKPNHPYTQALLAEMPRLEVGKRRYAPIKGEIPSPINPPSGCHFHPRCPHAFDRCRRERPMLTQIAPGRFSACHLNDRP